MTDNMSEQISKIAGGLSVEEVKALELFNQRDWMEVPHEISNKLAENNLIRYHSVTLDRFLTNLGREVLAAATREPAEAGEGRVVADVSVLVKKIEAGLDRGLPYDGEDEIVRIAQMAWAVYHSGVQAELAALRRQLEQSGREKAGMREALETAAHIWKTWLHERETTLVDTTITFSDWLSRNVSLGTLAKVFEQAETSATSGADGQP